MALAYNYSRQLYGLNIRRAGVCYSTDPISGLCSNAAPCKNLSLSSSGTSPYGPNIPRGNVGKYVTETRLIQV